MHEIAESAARAFSHLVLTATGFAKVGDRGELGVDRGPVVPTIVQIGDGFGRVFLFAKLDVNVTDQMIAEIIADVHLFHLAVLALHLEEYVLEEVVVMLLQLQVRDGTGYLGRSSCVLRISIAVLEHDGLGKCGFVVKARAGSAVTTGADFEVKRTVDFVLFGPEDRGQIFRHDD